MQVGKEESTCVKELYGMKLANRERMKKELPKKILICCTVSMFNALDVCNFYRELCDIGSRAQKTLALTFYLASMYTEQQYCLNT